MKSISKLTSIHALVLTLCIASSAVAASFSADIVMEKKVFFEIASDERLFASPSHLMREKNEITAEMVKGIFSWDGNEREPAGFSSQTPGLDLSRGFNAADAFPANGAFCPGGSYL